MFYGTRIIKSTVAQGTFYTVPENKTFFLLSCFASESSNTASVDGYASLYLRPSASSVGEMLMFYPQARTGVATDAQNANGVLTFSVPLVVRSGEAFNLSANGNTFTATVIGYEIDTALLANFI